MSSFQIFIKLYSGRTITMDAYPYYTLNDVIQYIEDKDGIPKRFIKLYSNGKILYNHNATLEFYKIKKESCIHVGLTIIQNHP
jgi:hypothetical protein